MTPRFLPCCLSIVLLVSVQGCVIHIHDDGLAFGDDWVRDNSVRGSGYISEEIHTFTGIAGVQLATMGELEIRLGDKEELRIEADDNLLQHFEAERDGGTLRIGTIDRTWLRPSRTVRYTLTVKELEFIGLSSSGNAHAPALSADRLEIRVTSSGNLSVDDIEADSLDVRITSSGNVRIGDGVVDRLDLRLSSSGNYDGEFVRSARVIARVSSSGTARLWAEESIDASASSSGSISYSGDPEVFESSGRVRRIR